MANSGAGSHGDAARETGGEYQVFLNFRGSDTRHGFTDFLYRDLIYAGVHVFRDEDELHEGKGIGDNLLHAINHSILYISIFSQNYASSKWCLRELALMIDIVSKSQGQKSIYPIFFEVEPKDVKLKTSLYSDALLEHKKKFPVEVNDWRKALEKIDEIKGWNVKKDQSQAKIVESVVEKVLEKLETRQKLVPEHLVGLDDRVKHFTELLDVNYRDVRLIAIYGMGGIGKTTIAKVIFNHLSFHFGKCRSFLEDVRESLSTKEGIVELQKKLLSDVVGSGSVEQFKDSEHGMQRIGDTLSTKKVLVVLDDVDNREHIKKLIGHSLLHLGSRIIITTRNKAILQVEGFKGKILPFEMLKMDDGLALQLFCRHAFGRDIPPDDYQEISSEIVSSTGGLPLAIEVTGSLLRRRDEAFWKETFVRLRNVPEEGILKKLRISYDDLDVYQQQIFLDIACFFFNKSKIDAIYMWTDCQFYPERGIEVLTNKCLIKIFDNDKFWMHDQLIDMGRQIVHQENPSDLGKRSRLWTANEVLEIIKIEERKDKVQALQKNGRDHSIEITNEDFERFPNLRLLELQHGTFARDFKRCHSNLRWFSWSFPPEKDFRADNLYLDRLVVCKFHCIDFEDDSKAWDLIKRARALKLLSITWCLGITTIPDIFRCLNLERLTLEGCFSLKRIESFIGNLQSLIELKIEQCEHFMDLPEEIGNLVKLQHFSLSRCNKLRELPCSIGNLTSLTELNLSERSNAECFEATGNRWQMTDGRIGCYDSVDGGKIARMENREKYKDEIGEPANPSDVVGSSCQTCEGVEHYERSCKAKTEVEDQGDFSSVKRDRTVETDLVPGKGSLTGCASNPRRDPAERGRGKDIASSSRNDKGLRLVRGTASTLGKGTTSNLGKDIDSSSRSSATSSSGRAKGSRGATLSSGRGVTLSLGLGRGSSSRMDTSKTGITSSSRSNATLSTRSGRGSTSGKGTIVSSGRNTTLNLGRGTTKMVSSLRAGIQKGSSSAKGEPQTSRSREEQ